MDTRDEVPQWRKSTRSSSGNCVEVMTDPAAVLVRDSKNPDGPVLSFTRATFGDFLSGVRGSEFDLPVTGHAG
ncbi:DUF397 domain-containing protein [Actinoplanes sp. NPDC049118]|uniref:DUF397 domain-containing protein n=1 Tax=Actinoplanes sp. NPDC049118 TaxID=3155769 RepID=UPI0034004EE1